MSRTKRSWVWLWLAMATLVGVLAAEVFRLASYNPRVPVIFQQVEVLNSPIQAGDPVIVRIWREKYRDDCPVYSHRTAINQDGVAYQLPDALWIGGSSELDTIDVTYQTLPIMPPGNYELRVHLVYNCPGFQYQVDQPAARFRIIAGGGR